MSTGFLALALIATVALIAAVVFVLRSAKKAAARDSSMSPEGGFFASLVRAARYLTTRPRGHYEVPWFLFVGDNGAGKSSIALSLQSGDRQQDLLRRQGAGLDDSDTFVFDQGVLIEHPGGAADIEQRREQQRRFLRDLVRRRPERPLDGVILVVPAHLLKERDSSARRRLSDELYEQLFRLQKAIDFSLPVYVVVSQCDAVDGFDEFWTQIGEGRRSEIVGWSHDGKPDDAFDATWIAATRDALVDRFDALRLRTAGGSGPKQVEDAFLFPERLQELLEPLSSVLTQVFGASAFQAGFLMRGIYFAGVVGADGAATGQPRDDISFVHELVSEKVYEERNLGVPLSTGVWSRSPRQLLIQILSAVALAGWLAFGVDEGFEMLDQVNALRSTVLQLRDLTATTSARASDWRDDVCIDRTDTDRLLVTAARIDVRFATPYYPASYFGSLVESKAEWVANEVFEKVIFPGFRCHLQHEVGSFIALNDTIGAGTDTEVTEERYFSYLDAASDLWVAANDFREMSRPSDDPGKVGENLRLLARLYTYIYGSELPAEIDDETTRIGLSLTKTDYGERIQLPGLPPGNVHPLDDIESRIRENLDKLTTGFRDWVLDRLKSGGDIGLIRARSGGGNVSSPSDVVDWAAWVNDTWTYRSPGDNACIDYLRRIQERVTEMQLAHFDYNVDDVREAFSTESCYDKGIEYLRDVRWSGVGPVIERQDDGLYRFSNLADKAINGFSRARQLTYMSLPTEASQVCLVRSDGWDRAKLLQLDGYLHEFAAFSESMPVNGVDSTEAAVNTLVVEWARARLRDVASQLIHDSQIPMSPVTSRLDVQPVSRVEKSLSDASVRFANVALTLTRVQTSLAEQGLNDVRRDLGRCVESFVNDQLAFASTLADLSQIYRLRVVREEALANGDVAFFGLASKPEAESYVQTQVERIGVLVGYVEPFVRYTSMHRPAYVSATGLPRIWEASVEEFARYHQNKDAVSQVGLLNDFVVDELQGLTTENCRKTLRRYYPGSFGDDFFSSRRGFLYELASRRCLSIAEADLYRQANGVTSAFTIALDNRFPFGAAGSASASITRARDFFLDYAARRESGDEELEKALEEFGPDAEAFVQQLDDAAKFFASNLASESGLRPIRVATRFRPNGPLPDGTSQVYEWTMGTASSESARPHGEDSFDWNFGDAVAFRVIWADRSDYLPEEGVDGAMPWIGGPDDRSATFRENDPWALLTMIDNYAVPGNESSGCEVLTPSTDHAVVLCFPIRVVGKPDTNAGTEDVLFYVELELSGENTETNEWEPLSIPERFPHAAPQLKENRP